MSLPFSFRIPSYRTWTAAHIACVLSIAVGLVMGFLVLSRIFAGELAEDDAAWAVFELGYEHQRFMRAVETGAPSDEVRFRGEIYLSRVGIIRVAPTMAEVRLRVNDQSMATLFQSAEETDRLLRNLDQPGGREALRARLDADSGMIRALMLDVINIHRKIIAEKEANNVWHLMLYFAVLEILVLTMVGLSIILYRTMRKLRLAGRELAAQLATQEAILGSVDTAILGFGATGRVLYSNQNALALLGPAAAAGSRLAEGGDGQSGLVAEIAALLSEAVAGASHGMRQVHLKSDDSSRHYVIRVSATRAGPEAEEGHGPEPSSHIVSVTDVTTVEEAALRREEYDASLSDASRLLAYAAISGGIVHEISQPLAAIRNYAYSLKVLLGKKQATEEQRAMVALLGDEIDRAIEVVRNVRRMGPQDVHDAGVCDVREAIAHSVRLVTLGSNPPPPIKVMDGGGKALITGSLPMIGQVVINLLKNALSASSAADRPGAEVKVTLRDSHAEIAVADFGTGISPETAKSMFAPFSKSARGGMGLGLAICQRIAATLGGSLSWENREQGGAIFRFTVPLANQGSVR